MGKRRHRDRSSYDEEDLRDRIRRLESELKKKRRRNNDRGVDRHSRHNSTEPDRQSRSRVRRRYWDDYEYQDGHGSPQDYEYDGYVSSKVVGVANSSQPSREGSDSSHEEEDASSSESIENVPPMDTAESSNRNEVVVVHEKTADSVSQNTDLNKTSEEVQPEPLEHEKELDEQFLKIMGERIAPDRVLAPAIHKDIAIRWEEIIKVGLPEKERESLLKKYPPPNNCVLIDPPKLNLDVKAALDSSIIKRDERIFEKQKKLSAALAGIGKSLSITLKSSSEDSIAQFESINNAARLLADLQRDETAIRRNLVIKNIKNSFKETLKDSKTDDWLFGKDLTEKLKATKVLQRSVNELRPSTNAKKHYESDKVSKNFKGPPRQNQFKSFDNQRRGGQKQTQTKKQFPYNRNQNSKRYQSNQTKSTSK